MAWRCLASTALIVSFLTFAVTLPPPSSAAPTQPKANNSDSDPSGMYSFVREGEFVQITVEDGKLTGYVSRFGDTESDKDTFIDQFFDKTSLNGDRLSFTTKTVHGTWYEFTGVVTKTAGKQPAQEAYRVIKGTLIQHTTDANHADKPRNRELVLKSFPEEASKP
jgi:hypothetical protein